MKNFDYYTLNKIYRSFSPFHRQKFHFTSEKNWQTYVALEWQMTLSLLFLVLFAIAGVFLADFLIKQIFYKLLLSRKIHATIAAFLIPLAAIAVYYFNKKIFIYRNLKMEFTESFYNDIFYQI